MHYATFSLSFTPSRLNRPPKAEAAWTCGNGAKRNGKSFCSLGSRVPPAHIPRPHALDAASHPWRTEYDALGRPRKTHRPSGHYETYGYDDLGHRTAFWNAEFNPMTWGVDAQGRVTSITNAINKVTRFGYNPDGTLGWRIDGNRKRTKYGYDALNRLVTVTNFGDWKASFDHDANGNVTLATNAAARVTFGYDAMNRLTASTQSVQAASSVVGYAYDLNGNRTNLVYPGGLNVGYLYDAENRLESVTVSGTPLAAPISTSFSYDSASRMTNIRYPNSANSSFGYDAESRVSSFSHSIVHGNTHNIFAARVIWRDPRGYKTTEFHTTGLAPALIEGEQRFTNNEADQTTQIDQRDSWLGGELNQWYHRKYTYNDNGCMTVERVSSPPPHHSGRRPFQRVGLRQPPLVELEQFLQISQSRIL